MPYKDKEAQNEAMKFVMRRIRLKKKLEAEARGEKYIEDVPETPENLNYGMTANSEKPLTWDEFLALNPEATKHQWINYKIQFAYSHKWKAEAETEKQKRQIKERNTYGTSNRDCIIWRRLVSSGRKADFLYNHNCASCQRWYAIHKNNSTLDLNDTGSKSDNFTELKGYLDAFSNKTPYPEDFIYTPNGAFPMNAICSTCGTPLNRGKCPVCEPDPEG